MIELRWAQFDLRDEPVPEGAIVVGDFGFYQVLQYRFGVRWHNVKVAKGDSQKLAPVIPDESEK